MRGRILTAGLVSAAVLAGAASLSPSAQAQALPMCGGQGALNQTSPNGYDCRSEKTYSLAGGASVVVTGVWHVNPDRTGSVTITLSRKVPAKFGLQLRVHDDGSSTPLPPGESWTTLPANELSTVLPIVAPTGTQFCYSQHDLKGRFGVDGSPGHWDAQYRIGGPTFVFPGPSPQCQPAPATTVATTTPTTLPGATPVAPGPSQPTANGQALAQGGAAALPATGDETGKALGVVAAVLALGALCFFVGRKPTEA